MSNECIHMDRLAFAMASNDKEGLGEALHWVKQLSKRANEIDQLKLVLKIDRSVQNDPHKKQ